MLYRPTRFLSLTAALAILGAEDAPSAAQPNLRLIDQSLTVMVATGGSTADAQRLSELQGGGHDPNRRGFTLQQVEWALSGAVDPFFRVQANIVFVSDEVELEEAFATSTSLPAGLELKAGYYLTEFGRRNPLHPHTSAWIDTPVAVTRLLGADGMRSIGCRLGASLPTPWLSNLYLGAQNPDDATMAGFTGIEEDGEATIGNREGTANADVQTPSDLVWSTRWINAWDVQRHTFKGGLSGVVGPNRSGNDGHTTLLGIDLAAKFRAAGGRDTRWCTIECEAILRRFAAAAGSHDDDGDPSTAGLAVAADTLSDWGVYAQVLYGFRPAWATGLRYEILAGTGDSYEAGVAVSAADDPAREDRTRISPVLTWNPTHFSKLRLQYNYDHYSSQDDRPDGNDHAHSVWLGAEFLIGAHPAHGF